MKKNLFSRVGALLANLLLVYIGYSITRLAFMLENLPLFSGHLSAGYVFELFSAGLIFDTTAIMYTNALFILLFLFPLHWKENQAYYNVVRWLFVVINGIGLSANLMDSVYFRFSGRRTTMSVFEEFSHEGGGNILSILSEGVVSHWYLLVLAVVLIYGLYRFFQRPSCNLDHKIPYYIVQTVSLLAAVPFVIFGMRGGMTTATRPITISNANQYVNRPLDAGIVLNTPFSIFRTLGKKAFVTPNYMSKEEALRVYSPLHIPADSVQFKPMNVVVFIIESFSKEFVGAYNHHLDNGTYKGYTPFFDSLLPKGLTFTYSYSNGRKSIDGMPSVLSSIPNFVEPFFLTPASLNEVSSLAGELSRNKGYYSAFFHGAMNGSMGFEAFARSVGFNSYWGRTEYNGEPSYNGDEDFDGTWAIWDEEFLQFYCDKMSTFKEPFMTSVFTATSHHPFALPERYQGQFAEGTHPIHKCVRYTDYSLKKFFEKAEKQPWFKNTLFVVTADHTSMTEYPEYVTDLGLYKVPIFFYAPGLPELKGWDEHKIVEQIDIMPTVLGILGYDRPYVAFGQDVVHTPAADKFAVNYIPSSGVYQFLKDDYLIQFDGNKLLKAYRYKTDKLMENDVLNTMPQDTLRQMEKQMKSVIQQYMEAMNEDKLVYKD